MERIAAELVARGHRVTLICAAHSNAAARETGPGGVSILRRGNQHTVYLRAALTYLGGALGIGPLSRRALGRPDVIVDVGNGMPFLSKLYARIPVIALVHHVHREQWPVVMGHPLLAKLGWWIESRLAVRVYRQCRYVTVSEATRDELATLGVDPRRVSIVHNGTPEMPGPMAAKAPDPTLLVLCRLVPHKRVEIALRAVARLAPRYPRLRLVVAGVGYWGEQLRQSAAELGIADRVEFTGFVSEPHKQELFGQAWIALNPSLKEGWGLTIVEAASQGTPTVAFAEAGGVAEALVHGKTGLLAEDEADFAAAVQELLDDDEGRKTMGEAAREHAEGFTWHASGERFATIVAAATSPAGATALPDIARPSAIPR